MAATNSLPTFVYKIVETSPPDVLPHALPLSDLDAKDGFIHLSDAVQAPKTADLFFGSARTLWFLKISTAAVEKEGFVLKRTTESPGCVHLYGRSAGEQGRLGEGTVIAVKSFERLDGASWSEVIEEQGAWID